MSHGTLLETESFASRLHDSLSHAEVIMHRDVWEGKGNENIRTVFYKLLAGFPCWDI